MTKILNYSTKFLLDEKGDGGEIKGYASVFGNRNYWGDIVERGAFTDFIAAMQDAKVSIPLIFEHKSDDISAYVGTVDTISEDEKGLYITASLADTDEAKRVRELLDDNTLNDFSVGITAHEYEFDGEGDLIRKASLREVSIVLSGADTYAKIEKDGVPDPAVAAGLGLNFSVEGEQEEKPAEPEQAEPEETPAELETVEDEPVEDNGEETTEETPEETEPEGEETPEPETEQADENEPEQEETGENTDFSEETETPEDKEETETVKEKEYSMTKIETAEALPKSLTMGQSLIKQMKADPHAKHYEIKAYTAGNADTLKYEGAFQSVENVVSDTGYNGVDYIDLFTVIDTDSNAMNLTKITYEGKPGVTADAGKKHRITGTPTPITDVITKLAGVLSVSDACVEDGLYDEIDADLAELLVLSRNEYLVSTALDEATEITGTGNLYNDIINAAAKIRGKGGSNLTLFVNSDDAATLQAGQGQGCCGLILDRLSPWGISAIEFVEDAVEAGKFVLGDFKAQRVYRRTAIRVERATQSEDHFEYDISDFRVYQRLGLFVRRPQLLVKSA